jgi:hypothetical protein
VDSYRARTNYFAAFEIAAALGTRVALNTNDLNNKALLNRIGSLHACPD